MLFCFGLDFRRRLLFDPPHRHHAGPEPTGALAAAAEPHEAPSGAIVGVLLWIDPSLQTDVFGLPPPPPGGQSLWFSRASPRGSFHHPAESQIRNFFSSPQTPNFRCTRTKAQGGERGGGVIKLPVQPAACFRAPKGGPSPPFGG